MSKGKTIAPSLVEGRASRQAHADLPAGTYERELGREGFYGPASHMYHAHPPTAWSAIDGPLRPRAFDANKIAEPSASPWAAQRIFGNAHVNFSLWHLDGAMPDLARSGDGDVLLFVHQGAGELFCDYGHLSIRDGDYVVLPRGTMWRIEAEGRLSALIIEALGSAYELPERGLVGAHAQFDPAVLDIPAIDDAFHAQQGDGEWRVEVKRHGEISRVRYGFNPLDAVGWHGDLMPVRLNWRDIRPLMSPRYHLPPSAHTTFIAGRFVICTFVPKPMESDPGALRAPFFHNNDDYDEVLFYHGGNYFGRDNIGPGWLTLHPAGLPHGPHPKALAADPGNVDGAHDGIAVMMDTRDALDVAALPDDVEWTDYVNSWQGYLDKDSAT